MTAHKSTPRKALYLSVTLEKLKQPIIGAFYRPHFCSGLLGHHKQDSPGRAECKLLKETIREIAPMSKVLFRACAALNQTYTPTEQKIGKVP